MWRRMRTCLFLPLDSMKNLITILRLSLWASLVIFGPGVGSLSAAAAAPVSVQFVNPGKFADFQVQGRDVNYTAGLFANSVNKELTPLMKSKYPNGSLVLRFTEIDLVGRYSTAKDVRMIREGHPARMAFDFVLSDANGKVLAKGS